MCVCRSEFPAAVKQYRHRSVIVDLHHHIGLEYPLLDMYILFSDQFDDPPVKGSGIIRRCSIGKAGTLALAYISQKGELRYCQYLSSCVLHGKIHLSVFVLEYPQSGDLVCNI